jgi:hypothetical protein
MDETDHHYQYVRTVMLEVMAVLWANGQTQLHVGAVMRLLGVPEEAASKHDEERIDIDENFSQIASELNIKYLMQSQVPSGATIH